MAVVNFSAWAPDQPRLNNRCITAENVYPIARGYGPFPAAASATNALAAACVGVISFKQVDGTIETFAGTATKLYRLSGSSWTDVSKAGGTYTSSSFWRFAVFGQRLIATNGADAVQKFDLGSDTEFADLAGSPPTHNFPMVIRDSLIAIDLTDGSGQEIAFSAVNDSEKWTSDCGGGSQDLPDGGPVMGGTGGEFGIIIQESALTRMNFVGGNLRYTFDKIEGAVGALSPDSIVQYKGRTFYLSDEGFQEFNGAESRNISDEFVSDHFFSNLDFANVANVRGALDPRNSSVVWQYPVTGANKLIIYNYRLGQWSEATPDVTCLHSAVTSTGVRLGAFDASNQRIVFTGSDLTAKVSTGDMKLGRDSRVFVKGVRGLVDAAHDVTVANKTDLADAEATVTASANADGKASMRSNGRYHRFEVSPTAAFTELVGVNIEVSQSGRRS